MKWKQGGPDTAASLGPNGTFVLEDYAKQHHLHAGSRLTLLTPSGRVLDSKFKGLSDVALKEAKTLGCSYADIRFNATHHQDVRVRNGEVDNLSSDVDRAIGVRVLVGNGWGFAASSDVSDESLHLTARNPGGHSSLPRRDNAIYALAAGHTVRGLIAYGDQVRGMAWEKFCSSFAFDVFGVLLR